ncbi:MAG: hypothetical protein WC223_13160 [Bacteroidales bacterium]|jgi:hypothetical protein
MKYHTVRKIKRENHTIENILKVGYWIVMLSAIAYFGTHYILYLVK